jgi:hypothetical protein
VNVRVLLRSAGGNWRDGSLRYNAYAVRIICLKTSLEINAKHREPLVAGFTLAQEHIRIKVAR